MTHPVIQPAGVLIRFALGGGAVALAYILARRLGGKWGGIFAAFPAVYIASIITVALGLPVLQAVPLTLAVSRGALVGMVSNIVCALTACWAVPRMGWKSGLASGLGVWLICVSVVYLVMVQSGTVR